MEEGFRWTFTTPETVEATQGQRAAVPYSVGHLLGPGTDRLPFITKASDVMHFDLNSCFASIEQQCNALLRGKPVAVAAYASPRGCILSPSVEAKRFGVKTGMRVMDGKKLCPDLVVLPPDPWKYRWVNQKLRRLCESYTPDFAMKSIDEAVLRFARTSKTVDGSPLTVDSTKHSVNGQWSTVNADLFQIGVDLKRRIREEIGDWLRISVGMGPNWWLAKTAAGLKKPDGLEEINWWNIEAVLEKMRLEDLHGINRGNATRLRRCELLTPMDVYRADIPTLRRAFQSILGLYWHLKMRGYEVDDVSTPRKSFSHVYSLPKPARTMEELGSVVSKLVDSLGYRLRKGGFWARGLAVGANYSLDYHDGWYHHHVMERCLYDTADIYREVMRLFELQPTLTMRRGGLVMVPVRKVFVGCFGLEKERQLQTTWLHDELKKRRLVAAVDKVKADWGKHSLVPARMLEVQKKGWLPDFVAFGGVRELTELDEGEEWDFGAWVEDEGVDPDFAVT